MFYKRKIRNYPLPYKSYVAKLAQSGAAAPTAGVMFKDGIESIIWTRTGAGVYRGTLAGAFPSGKTEIGISNQFNLETGNQFSLSRISADAVEVVSKVVAAGVGTNTDALLGVLDNVIEIRVFI